jgi:hypothetical protein
VLCHIEFHYLDLIDNDSLGELFGTMILILKYIIIAYEAMCKPFLIRALAIPRHTSTISDTFLCNVQRIILIINNPSELYYQPTNQPVPNQCKTVNKYARSTFMLHIFKLSMFTESKALDGLYHQQHTPHTHTHTHTHHTYTHSDTSSSSYFAIYIAFFFHL